MNNQRIEQLKLIRDNAVDAKAVGKCDSTAPWVRFLRDVNPDFVIAVLDELIAFREAAEKPVAFASVGRNGKKHLTRFEPEQWRGAVIVTPLYTAPQLPAEIQITDSMALAFHHALTDGSIGSDDLEEIKIGLRAALVNIAPLAQEKADE